MKKPCKNCDYENDCAHNHDYSKCYTNNHATGQILYGRPGHWNDKGTWFIYDDGGWPRREINPLTLR